jgi:drug/metabolite transporter (DMT)-like permease
LSASRPELGERRAVAAWADRAVLAAPLLLGLALFAGYGLQTLGLSTTTPAKAGFITGLSVVIVPIAAALALRQHPGRGAGAGVFLATLGLALLTWSRGWRTNTGDLLVFGCAVAFAAHILLTGRFTRRMAATWLTLGEILTVALCSGVAALVFEARPPLTRPVLGAAIFTGVLATSVAFTVQTAAQRFTTATHTALILSAEPVFAALASYVLIGETLGARQFAGCALILGGMLAAELLR